MIYLIGTAPDSGAYQQSSFVRFLQWERDQANLQLDIETNVTDWWCDRKLMTIQFGDINNETQWVLQWSALTPEAQGYVKKILEDPAKCKLAHNVMFEAIVLLFHGIRLVNVYDTMLVEMILYCGTVFKEDDTENDDSEESAGFYALTSLTNRYLAYRMDKTEQLSFGDDILTESKVIYAASDVKPLGAIHAMQLQQLSQLDLEYVAALECEVVLAYAEMTYNGMELDVVKWMENADLATPLVQKAKNELDEWLKTDVFRSKAIELGYYSVEDRITINWKSPLQKKLVADHYFPFLNEKLSKSVLTRILRVYDKDGTHPFSDIRALDYVRLFLEEQWDKLNAIILEIDRNWLIDQGLMVPAGDITINWNSSAQVLPVLRVVNPRMANLDAESMSKFSHSIARSLENYKDSLKLLSTYGEKFIQKFVEPDGKVRTTFNQIVSTGRVSSRRPNMQNIPAKESVGTRYRNAFICSPQWKYVDSDFASQELVIIAYMSNDPVWNAALKKGEDLHSVCAEMVFPNNGWKNSAQPTCEYYYAHVDKKGKHWPANSRQKCNCKSHKSMRNAVKTINFGLAYGMSEYKLAPTLNITVQDAKKLIGDYFKAFPNIGGTLNFLGDFGVKKGYIQTIAPFFRKRWFPYWKYSISRIDSHLLKIQYDSTLGAIERASKNMPIQGTAGDMAKLSLLMLYNYIHDNDLSSKVKLVMQVHDQNTTQAVEDIAESWKDTMDKIMREAAAFIIPNGLLGAETNISDVWTK